MNRTQKQWLEERLARRPDLTPRELTRWATDAGLFECDVEGEDLRQLIVKANLPDVRRFLRERKKEPR